MVEKIQKIKDLLICNEFENKKNILKELEFVVFYLTKEPYNKEYLLKLDLLLELTQISIYINNAQK